jgi:WS/DGAT/MGAT family acyltransferase
MMEQLSTLDAGFYFAENSQTPMHIASVSILEGPPPRFEDFMEAVRIRLSVLPRYRQQVRTVPFGRPVWVEDPGFRLDYHVRHTAVAPPGGDANLRELAGRVLGHHLDMKRPLWELWLVEGLEGDRWALMAKVHHCVVDGVGGIDLLTTLFDVCPDSAWVGEPEPLGPLRPPGWLHLLLHGVKDAATAPLRFRPRLPGPALLRELWDFGAGLPRSVAQVFHPSVPELSGPIGPHRHWTWLTADLGSVRRARTAHHATVNDLVLAAVTAGFRDLLGKRSALLPDSRIRCLMPVSVRTKDELGKVSNRVSGVVVDLPCGEADPLARLAELSARTSELKHTHQALTAQSLVSLAGHAPAVLGLAARTVVTVAGSLFQTVVTNIPGPAFPLYVLGREVIAIYPFVPVAPGVHISVGVVSYRDRLCFGVTGEYDAVPDLDVLVEGMGRGLAELTDSFL